MEIRKRAKKVCKKRFTDYKAGILDQARLRPTTRYGDYAEARIASLLLKLRSLGKAENTLRFVSDRLK